MIRFLRLLALLILCASASARAQSIGTGTGFFLTADGYIGTNFHVIGGAQEISIKDVHGKVYPAEVVGFDEGNDLAILKIAIGNAASLPVRPSSQVQKGAPVFTVGFPDIQLQGDEAKVTEGIVSSLTGIAREPNHFQISVPIQPGNSGGPLVDATGAVVGITSAKLALKAGLQATGAVPENVNYAVKSNYLLELISTVPELSEKLRKPGSATKPLAANAREVERAVVLIVVKLEEHQAPAQSAPIAAAPRYEVDAAATAMLQKAKNLYASGKYPEAVVAAGKAADAGNADAQFFMAELYARGNGVAKDPAQVFSWALKAAKQGHVQAMRDVGIMYTRGVGVAKDEATAFSWLHKAAEQDDETAQDLVGAMYLWGHGVVTDQAEGFRWLSKSASKYSPAGMRDLGLAYVLGWGTEVDVNQAFSLFYKAAQANDTTAEAILGIYYAKGSGTTTNYEEAKKWITKSADAGNTEGLYYMGVLYDNGWGYPENRQQALTWYRKAAAKGSKMAVEKIKYLEEGNTALPTTH